MSANSTGEVAGSSDDGGNCVESISETLCKAFTEVCNIFERDGATFVLGFGNGSNGSGSCERRGGSDSKSKSNNSGGTHVDKLNVKGKVLDKRLELGEVRSKS